MNNNCISEAIQICGNVHAFAVRLSTETGVRWESIQMLRWGASGIPIKYWSTVPPAIERITGIPVERIVPEVKWRRNRRGKPTNFVVAVTN